MLDALEASSTRPVDEVATETLTMLDADHVADLWQKALDRRQRDPEGAITAARTLLESVCKLILDDLAIPTRMMTFRSFTARLRVRSPWLQATTPRMRSSRFSEDAGQS